MKIYTKRGDDGSTGLFGGSRVQKDHLRIGAYGTLDELNSALGVVIVEALKHPPTQPLAAELLLIQGEIFQAGAELATPQEKKVPTGLVGVAQTERLEASIDRMEQELPELKSFILPGGSEAASRMHVARTISRRAEREMVAVHREEMLRPELLAYVNRLSDYFFVMARVLNHRLKVQDRPWSAPPA
jgi:cob(I)alamin adenosyltransferase